MSLCNELAANMFLLRFRDHRRVLYGQDQGSMSVGESITENFPAPTPQTLYFPIVMVVRSSRGGAPPVPSRYTQSSINLLCQSALPHIPAISPNAPSPDSTTIGGLLFMPLLDATDNLSDRLLHSDSLSRTHSCFLLSFDSPNRAKKNPMTLSRYHVR